MFYRTTDTESQILEREVAYPTIAPSPIQALNGQSARRHSQSGFNNLRRQTQVSQSSQNAALLEEEEQWGQVKKSQRSHSCPNIGQLVQSLHFQTFDDLNKIKEDGLTQTAEDDLTKSAEYDPTKTAEDDLTKTAKDDLTKTAESGNSDSMSSGNRGEIQKSKGDHKEHPKKSTSKKGSKKSAKKPSSKKYKKAASSKHQGLHVLHHLFMPVDMSYPMMAVNEEDESPAPSSEDSSPTWNVVYSPTDISSEGLDTIIEQTPSKDSADVITHSTEIETIPSWSTVNNSPETYHQDDKEKTHFSFDCSVEEPSVSTQMNVSELNRQQISQLEIAEMSDTNSQSEIDDEIFI